MKRLLQFLFQLCFIEIMCIEYLIVFTYFIETKIISEKNYIITLKNIIMLMLSIKINFFYRKILTLIINKCMLENYLFREYFNFIKFII